VTCALGYSRAGAGALIFAKQAPDILQGMARCLAKLGALPETVVWDREAAIAPRGKPTDAFAVEPGRSFASPEQARVLAVLTSGSRSRTRKKVQSAALMRSRGCSRTTASCDSDRETGGSTDPARAP